MKPFYWWPVSVFLMAMLLAAGSMAVEHSGEDNPPGGGEVAEGPPFLWPVPDNQGKIIAKDPKLPPLAVRPPLAEKCFDRDLMAFQSNMHNLEPEDDEGTRKFVASTRLGVNRLAKAVSKTASRAYIFHNDDKDRVVVAFRGSYDVAKKPEDWITDFAALPTVAGMKTKDGKDSSAFVHAGFWEAAREYRSLVNDVKAIVDEAKRNGRRPRVVVTGHSLGGAMAVLFSYFLAADVGIEPEVVVFGTPRLDPLDSFKIPYLTYGMFSRSRHYAMKDDIVVDLPPNGSKLPLPERTLLSMKGPLPPGLPGLKGRLLNHHPFMYVDSLTQECNEAYNTKVAKGYDDFVSGMGRIPTPRELDWFREQVKVHGVAEALNRTKAGEMPLRKEIRRTFRDHLGRDPTEAEYNKYLTIAPAARDYWPVMEGLYAMSEYRERWIEKVFKEFFKIGPTAEQKQYWLKKSEEFGDLQKTMELIIKHKGGPIP